MIYLNHKQAASFNKIREAAYFDKHSEFVYRPGGCNDNNNSYNDHVFNDNSYTLFLLKLAHCKLIYIIDLKCNVVESFCYMQGKIPSVYSSKLLSKFLQSFIQSYP